MDSTSTSENITPSQILSSATIAARPLSKIVATNPLGFIATLPLIIAGDTEKSKKDYSYVVYIKTNSAGEVYVGRTSIAFQSYICNIK